MNNQMNYGTIQAEAQSSLGQKPRASHVSNFIQYHLQYPIKAVKNTRVIIPNSVGRQDVISRCIVSVVFSMSGRSIFLGVIVTTLRMWPTPRR